MPIFKHFTPESIPYRRDGDIAKVSFRMPEGKLFYLATEIKDLIERDISNGYVGQMREAEFDTEKLMRVYNKDQHFKFRYIVDTNNQIFFALEGVPRTNAVSPAHYQLVSKSKDSADCYTAGNVIIESFVDENGQHTNPKIIKINHKSGDFEPEFDSMQIALKLLFQTPELFADELYIEKVTKGGGVISTTLYNVKDVKKEIDACVLVFPEPIASDPMCTPRQTQQAQAIAPVYPNVDAQPAAAAAAVSDVAVALNFDTDDDIEATTATVVSPIKRALPPAQTDAPSPKKPPFTFLMPLQLNGEKATSGLLIGTLTNAKEDTSRVLFSAGTLGSLGSLGSLGKR